MFGVRSAITGTSMATPHVVRRRGDADAAGHHRSGGDRGGAREVGRATRPRRPPGRDNTFGFGLGRARATRCADWGWRGENVRVAARRSPLAAPAGGAGRAGAVDSSVRVRHATQSFAAADTFDAAFGTHLPAVLRRRRAGSFRRQDTSSSCRRRGSGRPASARSSATVRHSRLGIPLTATITPLEVTGGYRFSCRRAEASCLRRRRRRLLRLQGDV